MYAYTGKNSWRRKKLWRLIAWRSVWPKNKDWYTKASQLFTERQCHVNKAKIPEDWSLSALSLALFYIIRRTRVYPSRTRVHTTVYKISEGRLPKASLAAIPRGYKRRRWAQEENTRRESAKHSEHQDSLPEQHFLRSLATATSSRIAKKALRSPRGWK